jgi:L-lysine 6-transaminase
MVRFELEMKIVREEKLIEQVPAKAARLRAGLDRLAAMPGSLIRNPRGLGIYQGFSIRPPFKTADLLSIALETESLLMLGAGMNSVRLRPTPSVTEGEIDLLIEKLGRVCRAVSI